MALFLITGVLAAVTALIFLRAFVLTYLWAWFIVPFGALPIGMAHAIGLSLLIHIFTQGYHNDRGDPENPFKPFLTALLAVLLAWGIGAIAHSFM